jgi:hypothetical protein
LSTDEAVTELEMVTTHAEKFGHTSIQLDTEDARLVLNEIYSLKSTYEYNILTVKNGEDRIFYDTWSSEKDMADLWSVDTMEEVKEKFPSGWKLVKRIKPGGIEDV